jgi:hypothetical protein
MGGKTHGEVKRINGKRVASPEYRSWQMMKERCKDSSKHGYRKPLTMCATWLKFERFLADMGRKPSLSYTLDRINNESGYSKENCRWATRTEQARNRGKYNIFDLEAAEIIRFLYATGQFYQYEIAEVYGSTQAHISQITRNVAWRREVEGPR